MTRLAHRLTTAALAATLVAHVGCGDKSPDFADAGVAVDADPGPTTRQDISSVPLTRALDILFVIDNSGSMREEQQNLIRNFPRFIDALAAIEGGLPDVHIGVISTDVGAGTSIDGPCPIYGDDGALQVPAACRALLTTGDNFLRSSIGGTGGLDRNFVGDLDDAFACLAELGTRGCGFEQPLESIRRALDGRNIGFRRDGALLAIVVLSDEDDCSASDPALFGPADEALGPRDSFRCFEHGVRCDQGGRTFGSRDSCVSNETSAYMRPVSDYVSFLKGLGGPSDIDDAAILVAGIFGLHPTTLLPGPVAIAGDVGRPTEASLQPVCSTPSTGSAAPGVRLHQFFAGFPGRATRASICDENLSGSLAVIGDLIRARLGAACLTAPLADVDPVAAGDQIECTVSHVTAPGTAGEATIAVPPCSATNSQAPCWRPVTDADSCPAAAHQAIEVLRPAVVPPGTYERRQCTVVAAP